MTLTIRPPICLSNLFLTCNVDWLTREQKTHKCSKCNGDLTMIRTEPPPHPHHQTRILIGPQPRYGNQLQFNCPLYMPSGEAMFIHSVCLFVRFYHLLAVQFYRAIIKQQKQRLGSPPSNWIWKYGYRVSVSIRFPIGSRSPPQNSFSPVTARARALSLSLSRIHVFFHS